MSRAVAARCARALSALTASSSAPVAIVQTARASTRDAFASSRALSSSLLLMNSRSFSVVSTPPTHSAYGVTDSEIFEVPSEALERASDASAVKKPTKRKNHIKRMLAREAFRRENARVHKENKRRAIAERDVKRLEKWRSAVALKKELEESVGSRD